MWRADRFREQRRISVKQPSMGCNDKMIVLLCFITVSFDRGLIHDDKLNLIFDIHRQILWLQMLLVPAKAEQTLSWTSQLQVLRALDGQRTFPENRV